MKISSEFLLEISTGIHSAISPLNYPDNLSEAFPTVPTKVLSIIQPLRISGRIFSGTASGVLLRIHLEAS